MTVQAAPTAPSASRLGRLLERSRLYNLMFGARRIEPAPIYLAQRRVYILPTLQGITFAMAIVLMLIGSVNYALSLGFFLTFLLVGMSLVGMVHTYRNLLHLYVTPGRTEPVFAGGRASCVIHLENRARYERLSIVARRLDAAAIVDIPGGEIGTASLLVAAERRGWLELGRVTLETRYPLGIFRAWAYVQPEVRVLVYPSPDANDLPPESVMPEHGEAVEIGSGTDDFAGLRTYQPSDSPRHVAWKHAARNDTLMVKQWSGRGAAELWLEWASLGGEFDVEARLSRLTGWVLRADESGRAYGLRLPGIEIPPGRGPQHRDRCLKELALFGL